MEKKLPIYELRINHEDEAIVNMVSLVEEPAIESNFFAFSKEYQQFNTNDEKMEIIGAAMIPDQLIYRKDKSGKEFNVFFSKETIRQIAQQYMKSGFQNNTNLNHKAIPADSFIFQSYLVDEEKGIKAPSNITAPDGSWIVGMKVESPKTWELVKEGKVKGFSIEGVFSMIEAKMAKHKSEDEEILELINRINDIINNK